MRIASGPRPDRARGGERFHQNDWGDRHATHHFGAGGVCDDEPRRRDFETGKFLTLFDSHTNETCISKSQHHTLKTLTLAKAMTTPPQR
jgi:hypothetical protein